MYDFIADNPGIVFPLAVLLATIMGASLLVVAWRNRHLPLRASIGALAATALLFTGMQLVFYYRINSPSFQLQRRTGLDVGSYAFRVVGDAVEHQLGEFRGKPVLLYLWATTCGPCRPSLPVLAQLASDFQGRAAIVLLSHEERDTLVAFAKRQNIPAICAYSPEPLVPPGESWAFPQAPRPTTFLIDGRGVVRRVMVGPRSGRHLRTLLEGLVAASASTAVQPPAEGNVRAATSS